MQMSHYLAGQMVQSLAEEPVGCLVHCLVMQTVHYWVQCLAEQMHGAEFVCGAG